MEPAEKARLNPIFLRQTIIIGNWNGLLLIFIIASIKDNGEW